MARIEDEWYAKFRDMTNVPFPDALRQRILAQARESTADAGGIDGVSTKDKTLVAGRRRWGRRWQPWLAGVGGFCILASMVWGELSWRADRAVQVPKKLNAPFALTRVTGDQSGATPRNAPFGLVRAPLSIAHVTVGSEPGFTKGSFVVASVTNLGATPLRKGQVFGVLWFTKHATPASLGAATWTAFVDFALKNGQQRLAPGSHGAWTFRPVGAPTSGGGQLTDVPHLSFYRAGLVNANTATTKWLQAQVRVQQTLVKQRKHWPGSQAIEVTTVLLNQSPKPLRLSRVLAVIWFAKTAQTDWTAPGVVRFLDTPTAVGGDMRDVGVGQTVKVSFSLIGSDKTDFLGMIPYVAIIQR